MEPQDEQRTDDEQVIRRAAELGHDPERVARALGRRRAAPSEAETTVPAEQKSWFGARASRGRARPRDDG